MLVRRMLRAWKWGCHKRQLRWQPHRLDTFNSNLTANYWSLLCFFICMHVQCEFAPRTTSQAPGVRCSFKFRILYAIWKLRRGICAMALCQYCRSITVVALIRKDKERRSYHGMDHQPTFSALVESAQTCQLCRLFHASIIEGVCDEHSNHSQNGNSSQQLRVYASGIAGGQGQTGDEFSNLQLRSITIMDKPLNFLGILEIFADHGIDCSTFSSRSSWQA